MIENNGLPEDESSEIPEEREESQKRHASDEFARMLEESLGGGKGAKEPKKLSPGDKVKGEILVAGKEEIFVSTGTANDGIVPRRDLLDKEGNFPYKVGDKLDLFVTQVRGTEIYLSPKPTAKNMADDLEDAFDMMLPVEGRVTEVVKGGVRVQLQGGKTAFCPISQLDSKRTETGEEYVGQKLEFKITKWEGGRNVVVSRRQLLEESRGLNEGAFQAEHREGEVVDARIARLEKFGAFAELAPGVDGLIHISELSWSRVNDPAEAVQVGQNVRVKILKYDFTGDRMRISLSLKQAEGEPWDKLPEQIQEGRVVEGKVTRCAKFGAFVELAPGIEGLIPLSEMSYTKRVMRSDELVKEGETVSVMIKNIDRGTRRLSLSLKDAGEGDPWGQVAAKFPVGTVFQGRVEKREPFGLFVKLDEGVVGLLPKSKALEATDFNYDKWKVGDTITLQVGELRLGERRISLQVPGGSDIADWKDYQAKQKAQTSFGTLADKLQAALKKK